MKKQLETTTDVLNKAASIAALARLVNNQQRKNRLEVERQDVLRIANGALETGGFDSQARNELMAAKYFLGTVYNEARKENANNERRARIYS